MELFEEVVTILACGQMGHAQNQFILLEGVQHSRSGVSSSANRQRLDLQHGDAILRTVQNVVGRCHKLFRKVASDRLLAKLLGRTTGAASSIRASEPFNLNEDAAERP